MKQQVNAKNVTNASIWVKFISKNNNMLEIEHSFKDDIAPHIKRNCEIHFLEILKCSFPSLKFMTVEVCNFRFTI